MWPVTWILSGQCSPLGAKWTPSRYRYEAADMQVTATAHTSTSLNHENFVQELKERECPSSLTLTLNILP